MISHRERYERIAKRELGAALIRLHGASADDGRQLTLGRVLAIRCQMTRAEFGDLVRQADGPRIASKDLDHRLSVVEDLVADAQSTIRTLVDGGWTIGEACEALAALPALSEGLSEGERPISSFDGSSGTRMGRFMRRFGAIRTYRSMKHRG